MRTALAALLACAAAAASVACARPLRVHEAGPVASVPLEAPVIALTTRGERHDLGPGYRVVDGVLHAPDGWSYRPTPEDRLEYTRDLYEGDPTPRGGAVVHRFGVPQLAAGGAIASFSVALAIIFVATCPRGTVESVNENKGTCSTEALLFGGGFGGAGIGLIAAGLRGELHDTAADRKPTAATGPILAPLVVRDGGGARIGIRF